jgi:phage shock protein A
MNDTQEKLQSLDSLPQVPEGFQPQEQPQDQSQEEVQQTAPEEKPQEKNFKQLKHKYARIEKERDEYARRLAEIEAKPVPVEEDDSINLAPDDLAEGKHLTKMGRKVKKLEEELNRYKNQSAASMAETRLRTQYPDIDSVVTHENIEALKDSYPELAATLNSSPDLYTKAVSAYTLIKKLGINGQDAFQEEKALAQKNAAKPRPLTSVSPQQGDSPLSRANAFANGLTEDLKVQLRKEMLEAMKNR